MTVPNLKAVSTQQPSDSDIIALALKGEQKAFRQLVNRYLPQVYNVIYRMTSNADLSEEIAQEAFVKAYHHLKSFDRTRPFRPWIMRIASNAAISELRKQSKVVSLNALEEEGTWSEAEHQTSEDTVVTLERKLANEEVMKALGRMEDKYKQVLILRYQQEFSYEEIAEAMDIPLNTVRTWLKRGLDKLKNEVKEMALYE